MRREDVTVRAAAPALGFMVLAVSVAAWWFFISYVPASRAWFFPGGVVAPPLRAFVVPDLLVLALGSALSAWMLLTGRRGAVAAAWFVAGAACYAAAYTVSWALDDNVPPASPVLMIAAAALSLICARRAVPRSR